MNANLTSAGLGMGSGPNTALCAPGPTGEAACRCSYRRALITGITGQDGSYLAEYLLLHGYAVAGTYRNVYDTSTAWKGEVFGYRGPLHRVELFQADITDAARMEQIIVEFGPTEIYNLAAQSHVGRSFLEPYLTTSANYIAVLNILEAVRRHCPKCKVYQASTSEMFGNAAEEFQDENTPLAPVSPYGIAKTSAHYLIRLYREAYGIYAVAGILFNHESPRRSQAFVTRKITAGVARIVTRPKASRLDNLFLPMGNLHARRDWGYAPEYVMAIHKMMNLAAPEDFVIATGETHSVGEFLEEAFNYAGLRYEDWISESAVNTRPNELRNLCGNYAKAGRVLEWKPLVTFAEIVRLMVEADIARAKAGTLEPKGDSY